MTRRQRKRMMKLVYRLTVLLFHLNVFLRELSVGVHPGMKIKVSSLGISRIADISKRIAKKKLPNLPLPSISGDTKTSLGTLHYEAWNIKIDNVLSLDYFASIAQNGTLIVTVQDAGLTASGQWSFKLGIIKDHGTFEVTARGLKLNTRFLIGIDGRGMVTVQDKECNGKFGSISLEFHKWIYDQFKKDIEKELNKPCDIMRDSVIKEVARRLDQLSPRISVGHKIIFDASLLEAPKMNSENVELDHKGEFFYDADSTEAPFQPSPLPETWTPNRMLSLALTKYLFDSLSYVSHEHGMQEGIITRDILPPSLSELLNTNCSRFLCIGFMIPQLAYLYPNSFVEIQFNSTDFPRLELTKNGTSSSANNSYFFQARLPDGTTTDLFSLAANLSTKVDLSIEKNSPTLHWRITELNLSTALTESHIGWLPVRAGALVMEWILRLIAIPKINKRGAIGRRLPIPSGVNLYNAKLRFGDGYALVESDFDYSI